MAMTKATCPSYIAMSMLHRGKTYHDSQLPKAYICTVTNPPKNNTDTKSSRKSQLSFRLGHSSESVEFYILSSSSLALSSKIQDELANGVISFYQSLLSNHKDDGKSYLQTTLHKRKSPSTKTSLNDGQNDSWIRARIVPADRLSMNEARRILVEGYLPCKEMYIELGHVSNYTDYISRGLQIHCGGKKDFVHIIHGCINTAVVLDFLLENNIVCLGGKQYGILLSKGISDCMPGMKRPHPNIYTILEDGAIFLPFRRRMLKGKGGKVTIVDIENGKAEKPDRFKIVSAKLSKMNLQVNPSSKNDIMHEPAEKNPKMKLFNPETGPLTRKDIEYESMTSLSFLPFYTQK